MRKEVPSDVSESSETRAERSGGQRRSRPVRSHRAQCESGAVEPRWPALLDGEGWDLVREGRRTAKSLPSQTLDDSDLASAGHHRGMPTELLYLHDATLRSFEATVVEADEAGVALDRTAFYVTGGGQPHDTGILRWEGGEARVVDVRKKGDGAWHTLEGRVPAAGTAVHGEIDWDRRWALMRTHTALHVLCGVIWNTGARQSPEATCSRWRRGWISSSTHSHPASGPRSRSV